MFPDFCPGCDATDKPFRLIQRATEQGFRGETLRVTSPSLQCRHCGFGLLGPGHLDALRVATHDAYRRQHGLLTSGEITARRKAMGLSQKRFAAYLGVGSASIEPIKTKATRLIQDQGAEILFAASLHRELCRRQHRILGLELLLQAWVNQVDALIVSRDQLSNFFGISRFKSSRLVWLEPEVFGMLAAC